MVLLIEPSPDFTDPTRPTNPGDLYIALVTPGSVFPLKIQEIVSGQLIAQPETPTPPDPFTTKISQLILGRFAEAKLSWSYLTDGQAECTVKFIETPGEYTAPQPDLPEPAFLYIFTEQMPPAPLISRFTSYENNIVIPSGSYAGTYTPAPFSHKTVDEGVKLDEEKIEIDSFDFSLTTNPLRKAMDFALEGTLHVDVLEVDAGNLAAAPSMVFSGDFGGLDPKGKEWKATFREFGAWFSRQFPRYYFQRICAVPVFSPKCGLNRLIAAFFTDGTISAIAPDGSYIDVAAIAGHTNPVTRPANFFALGYFEAAGGPFIYERRNITQTAIVGGKLRVYFAKPLRKSGIGQVINMYPGCDGSSVTCLAKFNNLANFRGFPFIPDKNPTANVGQVEAATGGKKA